MAKNNIDFIGIGAQKAGTSWLFSRLDELPAFQLPYKKEIHYFDRDRSYPSPNFLAEDRLVKRLMNLRWSTKAVKRLLLSIHNLKKTKWLYRYYFSNYNDEWYLSLFDGIDKITGEISPSYAIIDEKDVVNMHLLLPDIKLIYLIRNPVERAWSHFRFSRLKRKKIKSMDEVTEEDILAFLKKDRQDSRSNYSKTLEVYTKYYRKEQLLIGFYDAITEQPQNLLKGIVEFLGGDSQSISLSNNIYKKDNVSPKAHIPFKVETFLKDHYQKEIKILADTLGGYCERWYEQLYNNGTKKTSKPCKSFTFLR